MDDRLMYATTIVVGEAGSGKTTKLMEIAKQAHVEGRKVCFLSLEETVASLKRRFDVNFEADIVAHLDEIKTALKALPPASVLVIDMLALATVSFDKVSTEVVLLSETLAYLQQMAREQGVELIVSVQVRRGYGMGGMGGEVVPLIVPEALERGDYNIVVVEKDRQ
jgi:KaiC/GvpD/RAD55 family RecA-like ATPase